MLTLRVNSKHLTNTHKERMLTLWWVGVRRLLYTQNAQHNNITLYLHRHILPSHSRLQIKVDDLGTESCRRLLIHLVAGVHELFGELQMATWQAVVSTQC